MSTRAKYFRVRPQQNQNETKLDTDILMKMSQSYGKYISRALTLFFGEEKPFVTIKAAQKVIQRALWVSEILRRKVPNLHQIITISEKKIVDIYEPKEEGLLRVENQRFLTLIQITLTKQPTAEQKKSPGYEAPIKVDEKELLTKEKWLERQNQRKNLRQEKGERAPKQNKGSRDHRQENKNRGQQRGGERKRGRN